MIGFRDITIKMTVDADLQTGELEVGVWTPDVPQREGCAPEAGQSFLWAYLADEEGNEADRIFPIEVQEQMQFCMRVEKPRLWDAERCCLYDLILEIRDENNEKLAETVKKTAFYRWERAGERWHLNGKEVRFALAQEPFASFEKTAKPDGKDVEAKVREALCAIKASGKNAVYAESKKGKNSLKELCLQYGIYLLFEYPQEAQLQAEGEEMGFALQVVEQGVLIENHNVFADARDYTLRFEIMREERMIWQDERTVPVPPGSSRFVELPCQMPKAAGRYRYRAALCLKKDTAWAKTGQEVAAGEAAVSNLWME